MITGTPATSRHREPHALSRMLATACLVLAWVLPLSVMGYLWISSDDTLAVAFGIVLNGQAPPASSWQRAALLLLGTLPAGCVAWGLMAARRCFLRFLQGEYFSTRVVQNLRGFSGGIFLSAVSSILLTPLLSVILTFGNHPAALAINIGSSQVLALLFAGMVWQIASVMTRAVGLAEENSQFV